jgi:hypothetical protein
MKMGLLLKRMIVVEMTPMVPSAGFGGGATAAFVPPAGEFSTLW